MTTNDNSQLRIDLTPLLGGPVGEPIEFERQVIQPKLGDLAKPASLKVGGTIEAIDDRWLVRGSVEVEVELICSRCLKTFRKVVSTDFSEEFARKPEDDQFPAEEARLELTEMLRTVLLLAAPDRPLHDPDCQGLCDTCGKDLNEEPHSHPERGKQNENPFSVLKRKPEPSSPRRRGSRSKTKD